MSLRKKADIAEILDIMEKADKDKYWVLERIQKKNLMVMVNPAMSRYDILNACPVDFITELIDTLRHLSAPDNQNCMPFILRRIIIEDF